MRNGSLIEKGFDLLQTRNSASGADLRALDRGRGVRETDNARQAPGSQNAVDERAVKDISRASRVGHRDFECGRCRYFAVVAKDSAAHAECDAHHRTAIPRHERAGSLFGFLLARELNGKFL